MAIMQRHDLYELIGESDEMLIRVEFFSDLPDDEEEDEVIIGCRKDGSGRTFTGVVQVIGKNKKDREKFKAELRGAWGGISVRGILKTDKRYNPPLTLSPHPDDSR